MKSKIKTMLLLMATLMVTLMMSSMVFAAPAKVTGVTQTGVSTSSATIAWNADLNAYSYEVLCSTSSTDWTAMDEPKTCYSTSTYFSGLSAGKSYYVKVRAVDKNNVAGDWSDTFEMITSPNSVDYKSIKQISATIKNATIQWSPVAGATSYVISKYVNGVETDLGETKGTTYTLTGFNTNTNYYIYVYAVRTSASGSAFSNSAGLYSGYINLIPGKMTKPEATNYWNSSKQIKLAWDAKEYADGYQIQMYKYNGKKPVKTITSKGTYTYYYLKNIKAATFYKFRIRAYTTVNGKTQYGAWSDYNYIGQQIKPKLSINSKSKKLSISWTKMKGATSYTVYMSTSQTTGYKKIATTKKNSVTVSKFKKKALQANQRYYVYVVANKKVGKKTYKSGADSCYYIYYYYTYRY